MPSPQTRPPAALLETAQDAELKLFVGVCVGRPYGREEIALIRAIVRTEGYADALTGGMDVYVRGTAILNAHADGPKPRQGRRAVRFDSCARVAAGKAMGYNRGRPSNPLGPGIELCQLRQSWGAIGTAQRTHE